MSALDAWRRHARAAIPRGFLRRDRGDGLFISDYPRYPDSGPVTDALRQAGFRVRLDGQLAVLGLSPAGIEAQAASLCGEARPTDETLYLWALAGRLIRSGGAATQADMPHIHFTLKCLDAGELSRLEKVLSPASALGQRTRHPLPAVIGRLMMDHLNH
ncbi:MAG: hypothetical protein IKQ41_00125 [Clostridia bacterium]|nr:hypothetical protein [Clostridia bacterium]